MKKSSSTFVQRLNVVHKIPDLIRLERFRKRWHWGTIEAGRQVLEQITSSFATLKVGSLGEVERKNRIAFTVRQRERGWTVASPLLAVAAPAIHALKQFRSPLHARGRGRWFWRYS